MDKVEHIKIIQGVITRMASNSFLIKGWCVTLVSAILALAAKEPNKIFIAVAFFPVIMFWILDGYFLYQERLFRKLYDSAAASQEVKTNFSMATDSFEGGDATWAEAALSKTLRLFYITMLICVLVIFLVALFIPAAAPTAVKTP